MDYIFLPQSATALDRWSDRAIRIVYWEFALAVVEVVSASSYFPKPSQFDYDHPPLTKIKLAVTVPTIFIPLASCFPSWQFLWRRARSRNSLRGKQATTRAPTTPGIYSFFQVLQLIAYAWVTAYDFVERSVRSPWFWFSLVWGLLPALAGTIYGLRGIVRFYFSELAQLRLRRYRSSVAGEEYLDDVTEESALERAYQQQFPDNATNPELAMSTPLAEDRASDGDILLSQLRNEAMIHTRLRDMQVHDDNAATREPGTPPDPVRNGQTRSWPPVNPSTKPRFRWQEQTGARNGGKTFWGPIVTTSSLMSIWGAYYRWLARNSYYSPALMRLLALEAFAPACASALSNIFLMMSLRKPLLALIFTAFCFTALASAIWFAEFAYSVWCFFYYFRRISVGFNFMSFALVLVSFGMTCCYVALLHCSVQMEWTPGYSSLKAEYKLWKERRSRAGSGLVEVEEEDN